jgi:F-type H+-transporting ATPase subunit epsilon
VLTPSGKAVGVEVIGAVVPLADGLMGFLPGRAPLIAQMGAGELVLREGPNVTHRYFVSGGFAHMAHGRMSVLAEECQAASAVDPKMANELLEQAQALPTDDPAQRQRRKQAIAVAKARLKVAESNL